LIQGKNTIKSIKEAVENGTPCIIFNVYLLQTTSHCFFLNVNFLFKSTGRCADFYGEVLINSRGSNVNNDNDLLKNKFDAFFKEENPSIELFNDFLTTLDEVFSFSKR
jgi:hypothetical protein